MPTQDPLTTCYRGLWALLLDNADFCALVPEQNRIMYVDHPTNAAKTASRFPLRDSKQAKEEPQVVIEPAAGMSDMYSSSDGTTFVEQFGIWVLTGDQRLCYLQDGAYQGLNPVRWAILRAMMPWEDSLKLLTWNGKRFIHDCRVIRQQPKMDSPRLPQQNAPASTPGWNLAWQGEVEMVFTSDDLPQT